MIDTNALRGVMAERGFSQSTVARKIGMTPKTFYVKMGRKVFDSDEIEAMIRLLDIPLERSMSIFFAHDVTYDVTKRKMMLQNEA